ncbi:hypothetical protein [Nocardia sp. NBC_01388]
MTDSTTPPTTTAAEPQAAQPEPSGPMTGVLAATVEVLLAPEGAA